MCETELHHTAQKLIEEFRDDYLLAMKNRKPATITSYVSDVKTYLSYLQKKYPDVENITVNKVLYLGFLVHLRKQKNTLHQHKDGLEASTVSRRLSGINAFWKFLYYKGMAPVVMSRDLMDIEVPYDRNPTRPITENEYRLILDEAFNVLEKTL